MNNTKILDCTLRDGGYVNNWDFGCENINTIIKELSNTNIDFIECGYLKNTIYNSNQTIFSKINQLQEIINDLNIKTPCCLMINYDEFPLENIDKSTNKNIFLRIAFKQHQLNDALIYCRKVQEKGYKIFIHPMHTGAYSEPELIDLVKKVNEINPFGFTIVDTTGSLKENNIIDLYNLLDKNLNTEIALAFHSHNNLNLSLTNAKLLTKLCQKRTLIIDTTLKGIGRGAGNLETEVFIKHLNAQKRTNLQNLIDEIINPIYTKTSKDFLDAYKTSAEIFCHPNYATFLIKNKIKKEDFYRILQMIPKDKRLSYDKDIIWNICKKELILN